MKLLFTWSTQWIAKRIAVAEKVKGKLNRDLMDKNKDLLERRLQDSLVMARMREELDFIANSKKEDKLIITGLTSKSTNGRRRKKEVD